MLSKWGDYSFPQYSLDQLPSLLLGQRRAYAAFKEAEAYREAAAESARISRAMTVESARSRPVYRTVKRLEPANHQKAGDERLLLNGDLWTCVSVERGPLIDEDSPSINGECLLGHEGERGLWVTWNIR